MILTDYENIIFVAYLITKDAYARIDYMFDLVFFVLVYSSML